MSVLMVGQLFLMRLINSAAVGAMCQCRREVVSGNWKRSVMFLKKELFGFAVFVLSDKERCNCQ